MDILFNCDPTISNLKQIELGRYDTRDYSNTWNNRMNKFEQEYLQCKKKWEKQGLKTKSLECIKHKQLKGLPISAASAIANIDSKHVWLNGIKIDLRNDKFFTNKCHPEMKILTVEKMIGFITNENDESIDRGLKIETMRLVSFRNSNAYGAQACYDICNKKLVIESLNLHNSLKNLTSEFIIHNSLTIVFDDCKKALENILQKKYYYKLENVNIILQLQYNLYNCNESIGWFFKLLKDNHKILKYQFKQLNIAVKDAFGYRSSRLYFILEWNNKIDDKSLEQDQERFNEMRCDDHDTAIDMHKYKQLQQKYLLMKTQWLN